MTYNEAVQWLYSAVPNFQRDSGGNNYKIGLDGPQELWSYLDYRRQHSYHPRSRYKWQRLYGTLDGFRDA